jgi:glucan phosphoethanolaminetransferase (alkaline phosphatase superfamily)
MKSNKILNIIIAAIAIIGAVLFVRVFMEDTEALETNVDLQNSVVSPLISFSTFLFYAAVVITILLSLWTIIKNPENLKKMLMSLAVLVVLFLVAYFMADSNEVMDANGIKVLPGGEAGSSINKWVGAGIWYSVILGGIASIFFVLDLGKGLIKS